MGKCYQFVNDMHLVHKPELESLGVVIGLVSPPPAWPAVGKLERGTRIRLVKVERRCDESRRDMTGARSAIVVTFARVESGPHTGKLIDTNGAGISYRGPNEEVYYVRPCEGEGSPAGK